MERDILKKGSQHILKECREIFRFIAEHTNQFSVERMGKVLNMSSSGYHYCRKHPVDTRQLNQDQLVSHIRRVYTQSQGRYGSPRIADELHEQDVKVSRNRIARLMRKSDIHSIMYKNTGCRLRTRIVITR